jgi:hypothetical protein
MVGFDQLYLQVNEMKVDRQKGLPAKPSKPTNVPLVTIRLATYCAKLNASIV